MQRIPTSIDKHSDTEMAVTWSTGEKNTISYKNLRFNCRCAECVEEWTRRRRVTLDKIRADIKPVSVELVGRYAVQIGWNDGHKTGIYTFDHLYDIASGKAETEDLSKI